VRTLRLILRILVAYPMTVTLYQPGQHPVAGSTEGFSELITVPRAQVPPQVATLLGCAYQLVDVLANEEEYVVYTELYLN
jgi:hypothetical protein